MQDQVGARDSSSRQKVPGALVHVPDFNEFKSLTCSQFLYEAAELPGLELYKEALLAGQVTPDSVRIFDGGKHQRLYMLILVALGSFVAVGDRLA